jgi:hypothetical protein
VGKSLRLLNLTLGLVAVLIAGAMAKTWVAPATSISGPSVAKPSQELAAVAFSRPARPPLARYDLLMERNPFKQPPPAPPGRHGPIPPPRPLPILSGTILVGDEWRAILSDRGKAQIYAIGQEVAGGVITAIKEDRIVLKRGDESVEVPLKAAIETGPAFPAAASIPTAPGVAAPSLLGPAPGEVFPGAAAAGPMDAAGKQMRKADKKAQKQQQKSQRKQSRNQ